MLALPLRRAGLGALVALACSAAAAQDDPYPNVAVGPSFLADGRLEQPRGFREWVFVGAPLTPDGFDDGSAGFPGIHDVPVEPSAAAHVRRTGAGPEGAVTVKERQRLRPGAFPDGSTLEPSGSGFFPGAPNGLDVSVTDGRRVARTGGRGFFSFGRHAPPDAAAAAAAGCAACRAVNRRADLTFVEFCRPLLAPPPPPAPRPPGAPPAPDVAPAAPFAADPAGHRARRRAARAAA